MTIGAPIELFRTERRPSTCRISLDWRGVPRASLNWTALAREELEKGRRLYPLLAATLLPTQFVRISVRQRSFVIDSKQHKTKEFWVSAIVFVSKDENLTKAHVRYLESRLLTEAAQIGRFTLEQNQAGGLGSFPESDREDMEVFLARIRQLLPVLGSDIFAPVTQPPPQLSPAACSSAASTEPRREASVTANGFVIFSRLYRRS